MLRSLLFLRLFLGHSLQTLEKVCKRSRRDGGRALHSQPNKKSRPPHPSRSAPPPIVPSPDDGGQRAKPREALAPADPGSRIPRGARRSAQLSLPPAKPPPPSSSRKGKRKDRTSKPTLPLPLFLEELRQKVPFCDSLDRKEGGGGQETPVPERRKFADSTHPCRSASAGRTNSAEAARAGSGVAPAAGAPLRPPPAPEARRTRCARFPQEKGGQPWNEIRKLGCSPSFAA